MTKKDERVFRAAAGALFASAVSVSAYHRRRADASGGKVSWRDEGLPTILALRACGLALWLSTSAYLANPRWMSWASIDLPAPLRWSGAGVAAVCLPMLRWTFRSLGKNVTPTVVTRERHELVTSGPYRWVRHPLYSVGTLFFGSFALLAANWFIALADLATLAVLISRLPREEEKLIEHFGDDYMEYMKRTGRLLPRPGGRS